MSAEEPGLQDDWAGRDRFERGSLFALPWPPARPAQRPPGTQTARTTRFTVLLHLPGGYKPEQVRDALAAKIQTRCPGRARH